MRHYHACIIFFVMGFRDAIIPSLNGFFRANLTRNG
jgi:hypothetical protein